MAYKPDADRFNVNAVADAQARHAAQRPAEPSDEDQARSILDGLPTWLALDSWRWLPGVQRLGGPRQRPQ